MIRFFKVKEQQRENAENAGGKPPVKKQTPGQLRLQKGIGYPGLYLLYCKSVLTWSTTACDSIFQM